MRATIYLTTAAIFWGLNFHFARIMLQETDFIGAGTWRYLLGVVTLFVFSYRAMPGLGKIRANIRGILLVGVIGLFGFNFLFFLGLEYTAPLNAALIMGLNPATTIILGRVIFKTRISLTQALGILIALMGVVYLLSRGDLFAISELQLNRGDLLIFAANLVFAGYHVSLKKYAANFSNREFTLITSLACLFALLVVFSMTRPWVMFDFSLDFYLAAIGVGSFGTALAFLAWNKGVHLIGAGRAGIFINLVPLSTAISSLFFQQELYFYHLVSGIIIIAGLLTLQTKGTLRLKKPEVLD